MMSINDTRWEIIWLVSRWGMNLGLICGAVYGTILTPLFGTVIGGIVGCLMGLVLGFLNGAYLGGVTVAHYYPLDNFDRYAETTTVQMVLITALGIVVIMAILAYGWWQLGLIEALPACIIFPTLIGCIATVLANWRVTHWYKKNVDFVLPKNNCGMSGHRMSRKFQRRTENFVCEHCGESVTGDGYTNHCPKCLWSKHVDVNPGDRAADCGGLMEPVGAEQKSGETILVHKCVTCGHIKRNRMAKDDNFSLMLKIMARGNKY